MPRSRRITILPEEIRQINIRMILRDFLKHDRLIISELEKVAGISKTTILKIVSQLVQCGILLPHGKAEPSDEKGRRPRVYSLCAKYRSVVAVQLFPTEAYAILTDLRSRILHRASRPVARETPFLDAVKAVADCVKDVMAMGGIDYDSLEAVCVAASGPTDSEKGTVIYAPRFSNWPRHAHFRDELSRHFPAGLKLYVDNEMRLQAIAEQRLGKATSNAVVLEAGDKLVASLLTPRGAVLGTHYTAGEIGHMMLDPNSDVKCVCGSHGCFLALVSERRAKSMAVENMANFPSSRLSTHGGGVTMQDIFTAFNEGDELAELVMEYLAKWMGLGFSNIILMYDPESIIIQGVYAGAGERFLERIRKNITEGRYPLLKELGTRIEYSNLGRDAGVLGGSLMVVERFIDSFTLPD